MSSEARIDVFALPNAPGPSKEISFGQITRGAHIVLVTCPQSARAVRLFVVGSTVHGEQYRLDEFVKNEISASRQALFAPIQIERTVNVDGTRRYIATLLLVASFVSDEFVWEKSIIHVMVRVARRR